MKNDVREELKRELASRGFNGWASPNGTMTLDDKYLAEVGIGELMEQLVARREKVFRSGSVVATAETKKAYDDTGAAVEAVRVVIDRLALRT